MASFHILATQDFNVIRLFFPDFVKFDYCRKLNRMALTRGAYIRQLPTIDNDITSKAVGIVVGISRTRYVGCMGDVSLEVITGAFRCLHRFI